MYLGGNRLWVPLQQVVGQPSRWASDLQAPIARAGLPVYALIPPTQLRRKPKQYSRDDIYERQIPYVRGTFFSN